jgi:hypothetical protein
MVKIYRKESISEIFNMINFRDLVIARTKVILGEIVTKYDYQLPGGGKINGDRILTDARADLEKMEKKIAEEAARPFIMTDLDL